MKLFYSTLVYLLFIYLLFTCLFTREGNGNPLQYSCLENPMDGGAWWDTVYGVAKSRTRLSNFTFTCLFNFLKCRLKTERHFNFYSVFC